MSAVRTVADGRERWLLSTTKPTGPGELPTGAGAGGDGKVTGVQAGRDMFAASRKTPTP